LEQPVLTKKNGSSPEKSPLLVLGTGNRKKRLELEQLLAGLPLRLATLAEFPEALEVEETGTTFGENAALKAGQQARHLNQWVLAEDSGLSVEALGGAPGVWSARYAGLPSNDERNNAKLMSELEGVPPQRRHAWYTCYACLANPAGEIVAQSVGECHGRIVSERRGVSGFGYDPYFELPEYHLTFAELGLEVKGVLSHRARAIRMLLPQLKACLGLGE
jgi:XTP/dITP diphosphohydrolase